MVFDKCGKMLWRFLAVLFVLALIMMKRNKSSIQAMRRMNAGKKPNDGSKLRYDWSDLALTSDIAKRIYENQNNCSLPVRKYEWRGLSGLGSDIHVWGNQAWAGLLFGFRVRSPGPWIWVDAEACEGTLSWHCYFLGVEPVCPMEEIQSESISNKFLDDKSLEKIIYTVPDFRAAATEFVFSHLSNVVIHEANRQLNLVFGDSGVPENLITVHVRWGDKAMETGPNNPIEEYINAVKTLVHENSMKSVNILLCTEDPMGVTAFKAEAPASWNIYMDHFYTEFLAYRENRELAYNLPSIITKEMNGKPGLWAMGSLLVAMEANYFVLTTKSNWARLMNELRKNVLNPRCGDCTVLIDLEMGEC